MQDARKKRAGIQVRVRKGESIDHALRRLHKKLERQGIWRELEERASYISRGERRRRKRERAAYRQAKEEMRQKRVVKGAIVL